MAAGDLASAISAYGVACKAKLDNKAATGAPEDQLRAPIEALFADFASLVGLPEGTLVLVGENTISELKIRPDYAVTCTQQPRRFYRGQSAGQGCHTNAIPRRTR